MKSRAYLLFLAVSSLSIFSIDQANACSADTYIRNCTGAITEIEAFKGSLSGGASAAAAANGSNINGNSFNLSSVTRDAASADTQGASYCQQQLTQCQAQCTKPTDQTQLQRCKKEIPPNIERCKQSAANLAKDSGDSKNSGNQSAGSPQMSPPQSSSSDPSSASPSSGASPSQSVSGSTSETPTTTAPATSPEFQVSCSGDSSYLYDKCTAQLSVECKGKFTGNSLCEQFSKRYCDVAASKSSSQASAGAMPAGQGKGSDYCMAFQGGDFCAKTPGSEVCPSCSHKVSESSAKLPEVCMGDPAYSNPAVAQASAAATAAGASAGGAGGGGGGAATNSAAVHLEESQSVEGHGSGLPKLSGLEASGGGGSSSSSSGGGQADEEPFKFQKLGGSRLPASVGANGTRVAATDVSVEAQSLFQLSSEVLLQRCLRGQLLHCGSK